MKSEASTGRRSQMAYRAFMVCSLATAATALAFFVIGIGDGSVSSFNMGLWLLLLSVLGCVLWAGLDALELLRNPKRLVATLRS